MPTILNHANDIFVWHVILLPISLWVIQKHEVVAAAELHTPSKHAQHLDAK
jgi:hypothetical protein